jgi:hypothetical protein
MLFADMKISVLFADFERDDVLNPEAQAIRQYGLNNQMTKKSASDFGRIGTASWYVNTLRKEPHLPSTGCCTRRHSARKSPVTSPISVSAKLPASQ